MKLTGWLVAITLIILGVVLSLPVLWIIGTVFAGLRLLRLVTLGIGAFLLMRWGDRE